MLARCLAVVAGLVVVQAAIADPADNAQLAVRARAILAKHCAACHGGQDPRSTLQILNYKQMVAERHTRFVIPQQPDLSQAVELVEQGSMPPGGNAKLTEEEIKDLKAWVTSGAAAYPAKFDDEFAYGAILTDVRKFDDDAELVDSRYLSIHHLADTLSPTELYSRRASFLAGLADLRIPGAPPPKPVDSTHTIYRIRLSESGWKHEPFRKILGQNQDADLKADLFDFVLLEYPHAVVPEASDAFSELVSRFLDKTQQVRPLAFVRGDWFVSVASSRPLVTDLHDLMKEYETALPKALAAHESQPKRTPEPLTPHEGPGVRIPALDAWFEPDPPIARLSVQGLKVDTISATGTAEAHTFRPGDTFRLRVAADEIMYYQFVWLNSAGRVDTKSDVTKYQALGLTPDLITLPHTPPGKKKNVLAEVTTPETEQVRVFVGPRQFDEGVRWRARLERRVVERFVHPLFPLKKVGDRMTVDVRDAQIVRRTIPIEIVPLKK
jgi:mono/diheme cytochrome c family protein